MGNSWASLAMSIARLVGLLGPLLFALEAAADWQVSEGEDAFTDEPVVTASVSTGSDDRLIVQCDATNSIVLVFEPMTPLRAEEPAVRYRVDREEAVVSTLVWENHNGRARTARAPKKSLFGEGGQEDEILSILQSLVRGGNFVIEAGGEQAQFSLRGSEKALLPVIGRCGIEIESTP